MTGRTRRRAVGGLRLAMVGAAASVALAAAPAGAQSSVPTPTLTVTIDLLGTVDDAGMAVASAVVSCDRATLVDAVGTITQRQWQSPPDAEGRFAIHGQPCTPEEPLLAFFPTRDRRAGNDLLFEVESDGVLEVRATPVTDPPSPPTVASSVVTLTDQEGLAAYLQYRLATEPNPVELWDLLRHAIHARLRQDPVFAAEWLALVGG